MLNRDKEPRNEHQANQKLADQKELSAYLGSVGIRANCIPSWKQRRQAEKRERFIRKLQNWCFVIEGLLIIGLLWLIAPQVVEHFFN